MKLVKRVKALTKICLSLFCYKAGILRLPYLPLALWIEPTNVCNLRCLMCPNSIISQKNPGFMDMELYKKIIYEAKTYVSVIFLCISGESLLHKNFPEMVKYAKDNNLSVYVPTNCTKLTSTLSRKILELGIDWINFSFDGCTKKIYEKVRVNANFEQSLRNVINFLKIKKELLAKTHCELQVLLMDEEGLKDYQENIQKFASQFKGLPLDYIQVRQPSTWGGFFSGTKKFVPKKLSKQFSPCSYLWCSMGILWDGRAVACCSDFFATNVLGKFPQMSMKDIWNGEKMLRFRKSMLDKKYLEFNKNCRGCDSLWEKRMLGLPAGIRGVDVAVLNSVFGRNFFGFFKKLGKILNPNFSMEVIDRKK